MNEATRIREMKAAHVRSPGVGDVAVVEVQPPGPGEVTIEVRRAGICGTDMHIWHGSYTLAEFPLVPGHEFSGRIVAVGADVSRFAVGDRVTADPNIPCDACPECQRSAFNQCHALEVVGVTRAGAFARFVTVPASVVYPLGDLSYAAGALVEPLACVVWGMKKLRMPLASNVLLLGAGPMGCLLVQALLRAGAAEVTVVDLEPSRLEMARRLGATHTVLSGDLSSRARTIAPLGFDVVVEATGIPAVLGSATTFVRPGASILVFGVAPEDATVAFSPFEIFRRDLTIVGSFAVNRTMSEAIALIRGGAIQVEPLVSHVVPIDDFVHGMTLAERDPDRMKIQFSLSEGE